MNAVRLVDVLNTNRVPIRQKDDLTRLALQACNRISRAMITEAPVPLPARAIDADIISIFRRPSHISSTSLAD
jgi:hypothetical protein